MMMYIEDRIAIIIVNMKQVKPKKGITLRKAQWGAIGRGISFNQYADFIESSEQRVIVNRFVGEIKWNVSN